MYVVNLVIHRQAEHVAPAQGIAGHFASGLADHVCSRAAPVPRAFLGQRPDALLGSAVAVAKVFVEDQLVAIEATFDLDMKALDDLAGALLEHAPGIHRADEILAQIKLWLLVSVMLDIDGGAAEQQQAASQDQYFFHDFVSPQGREVSSRAASSFSRQGRPA